MNYPRINACGLLWGTGRAIVYEVSGLMSCSVCIAQEMARTKESWLDYERLSPCQGVVVAGVLHGEDWHRHLLGETKALGLPWLPSREALGQETNKKTLFLKVLSVNALFLSAKT